MKVLCFIGGYLFAVSTLVYLQLEKEKRLYNE